MSVTGLCAVCERREAKSVCDRCGAAVCAAHYDTSAGVCTACRADLGGDESSEGDRGGDGHEHRL